jgi:hypothetical protein
MLDLPEAKPWAVLPRPRLRFPVLALCFVTTFLVYSSFIYRFLLFSSPPTGDQAWYMMMTISLVQDGDLDLRNNFENRDEDKFYSLAPHPPGFVGMSAPYPLPKNLAASRARPPDEWYNYHLPGLSVALVPAWIIGSWFELWWPACIVFMCGVGALVAVQILLLAYEFTGRVTVALAVWVALAFAHPVMTYSYLLFTELFTGLLLIYAFRRLALGWDANGTVRRLLVGGCIAFIPWVAWRCIALTVMLSLLAVTVWWRWRQLGRGRDLLSLFWMFSPVLASAALMVHFNLFLFGTILPPFETPDIATGPLFLPPWQGFEGLRRFLATGLALALDRTFGLLPYAPVYLLAIAGCIAMARTAHRRLLLLLTLVCAPYVALLMTFRLWHGTWCPAARYLTTLAPLAAAPLALSLAQSSRCLWGWLYRVLFVLLAVPGFGVIAVIMHDPRFMWPSEQGEVFRWLAESPILLRRIDLRPWVPSLRWPDVVENPATTGVAMVAASTAVLLCTVLFTACQRSRARRIGVARAPAQWRNLTLAWLATAPALIATWYIVNYEFLLPKTVLTEQKRWHIPQRLYDPRGIAYHAGSVYVTDYGERLGSGETRPGTLVRLDLVTGFFGDVRLTTDQGEVVPWAHPGDVEVGSDGLLYVLNNGADNLDLVAIMPGGQLVRSMPLLGYTRVGKGLAFGRDGTILVSDMAGGTIRRYPRQGGRPLLNYDGFRRGLNNPSDVAVDEEGRIYLTEGYPWVQQVASDGSFIRTYEVRSSPLYFAQPPDREWLDVGCIEGLVSLHKESGKVQLSRVGASDPPLDTARAITYGEANQLYVLFGEFVIQYLAQH